MTTQLSTIAEPTELAIAGNQTGFTDTQVAALRQIGIEDADDADLQVFFHHCRRTGLDPFARQIYMIGRETDVKVRVQLPNGNSRVETQRMTKFTIQTGIDGYRLIGERAAAANGDTIEHDDPLWRGKPGTDYDRWTDYWPEGVGTPAACKYTIWKNGKRRSAVVNFNEYAQYSGRGELTSMWKKMPANQLAKCGEAQAWRKAYPADFSGIILEGTDQSQVIDSDAQPVRVPSQRRGVDGLRDALGAEPAELAPAETPSYVVDEDTIVFNPEDRRKGLNFMFALFADADIAKDNREDRLIVTNHFLGETVESSNDLTDPQLYKLVKQLREWKEDGSLGDKVTEILNRHSLAQTETTQSATTTSK